MTLQEQATIAFYAWELRGRGYMLFDREVSVEPPYAPFTPITADPSEYIDDGKTPSIVKRITKLIGRSATKAKDEVFDIPDITPVPVTTEIGRVALSVTFPKGSVITPLLSQEFLNLLCYSQEAFSFEIVAQEGSITIQFTASTYDVERLESHLLAYFPQAIIRQGEANHILFDLESKVAIADFGLDSECMLPTNTTPSFDIDPLTSIIATLSTLDDTDIALFQVIFKGVTAPWKGQMLYASSDGKGGSFFEGYPSFFDRVKEKVAHPFFGVVMRVATQGVHDERSRYIATQLARSITSVTTSQYNRLIPLSNEGYLYEDHVRNVYQRSTNRIGFLLNSQELAHLVHYPNKTVTSNKLRLQGGKTKEANEVTNDGIYLGDNHHGGVDTPVHVDTVTRLSHCHIIGATGVGKSTLIANMILGDIEQGRGCAIFDPHGDICEDILSRIPEHRKSDIIVIDPADSEYPIGFNLLEANTEAEKIVLASDLVSAFKRHATAWGDNMTAVLQNAVATILDSTQGGTLIHLKRFLIEENFRNDFLQTVEDPSLHYYWNHEYPMVKKGIAPLLTRIDTFLRPKLVRYMLVQKTGVDVGRCMEEQKIVLLKLSQGLIGEANSFLLGSLFLAKFNQGALARQAQGKHERTPYMIYLDEFQNFITPSIERILSGARKYGLGLTIAHQELAQIAEPTLLNSVISNPKIRICFRLGDSDAKRLGTGFSYFEEEDLQGLGRGECIARIGSRNNDFNVKTRPLPDVTESYEDEILTHTRNTYGTKRAEVEAMLLSMLPNVSTKKPTKVEPTLPPKEVVPTTETVTAPEVPPTSEPQQRSFEEQKEALLAQEEERQQEHQHRAIANYILTLGQERNFRTQKEVRVDDGGRIDVTLHNDKHAIAVEISVTNSIDYEVANLKKCLKAGYGHVFLVSESKVHIKNIKKKIKEEVDTKAFKKLHFGSPSQFLSFLGRFDEPPKQTKKRVRGYVVKSNFTEVGGREATARNQQIQDIILKNLGKKGT